MSQGQPRRWSQEGGQDRPRNQQEVGLLDQQGPIKYGDVFNVTGDLARKTIEPKDASSMQSVETATFGQTQRGGPAAAMQSAATYNERAGLVGHPDDGNAAGNQGVVVTKTDIPGACVLTEKVAGQIVGQYVEPAPVQAATAEMVQGAITIGEALETTAETAGDKPVDQNDAAAIRVAETRAVGSTVTGPSGVSASAQSAADYNANKDLDEDKIKLCDVVTDATRKLPADKAVTGEDADRISGAEMVNNPNPTTHPGGIAASMTGAAMLNNNVNVNV